MESQAHQESRSCTYGLELRRYKVANADEIVEAARIVAGQRMQRGASFANPSGSGKFFQAKLGGLGAKCSQRHTSTRAIA